VNTKIQKIDYAVLHNPNLIPILIKDCSINNGLIYSRMRRLIPRRVGIEFECIGNPADYYKYTLKKNITCPLDFEKIFNLLDYDQDSPITRDDPSTNSVYNRNNELLSLNNRLYTDRNGNVPFNELRVSIKNYSQLRGLYNILELFNNSCIKPIGGGIHIHIDFSSYDNCNTRVIAKRYINNHLREVEDIFPKYTGTYNKRTVGISCKGTYVNLSCHGSIEFRIAPLTFNYEELIEWIIKCNKFVTKIIHECHLIPDSEIKEISYKPDPNLDICGWTNNEPIENENTHMTYVELHDLIHGLNNVTNRFNGHWSHWSDSTSYSS
jgi:hypothetical protein